MAVMAESVFNPHSKTTERAQRDVQRSRWHRTDASVPGCLRILVVDDNEDSADSLVMLLRIEGHAARAAYSGLSAIRIAVDWCPQAIVQDIAMPGMTGYDVARTLRQWPGTTGALLIALSGSEERKRSKEAGFDHHLVKPVDFEEIRRLLSRLIPEPDHAIPKASAA